MSFVLGDDNITTWLRNFDIYLLHRNTNAKKFIRLFVVMIFLVLFMFIAQCKSLKLCTSSDCSDRFNCGTKSQGPAKHCIDYTKTIQTERDKESILNRINSRRNKVASGEIHSLPSAANMLKMVWNYELEIVAQRWADQCVGRSNSVDKADHCRDLDDPFTGQNIATIYGDAPGLIPAALVDVWYMELLNTNVSVVSWYQTSENIPHYEYFTQLVWAESHQVGCGGVQFKEPLRVLDKERNRTVNRLVCNFSPGGNRVGRAVYADGVPCSRCPVNGSCDSVYRSLCNLKPIQDETVQNSTNRLNRVTESGEIISNIENILTEIPLLSSQLTASTTDDVSTSGQLFALDETSNDTNIPFDFISNLHELTTENYTVSTENYNLCNNDLAVDNFLELLKKKLSNDPVFKDILNTKPASAVSDSGFTDASVAAFVSRIYSKKELTTTSKMPEQDDVNSTLLADLVEAVIFRSGNKHTTEATTEESTPPIKVAPIRIQAELAEVKPNYEFTGHYFFPEDNDDEGKEEFSSETTESYYDSSNVLISDVMLEIEELKRKKTTKDFIEEILEFENVTEKPIYYSEVKKRKRELKPKVYVNREVQNRRKNRRINKSAYLDYNDESDDVSFVNYNYMTMTYKDLLKRLASDISFLNINKRLHCASVLNYNGAAKDLNHAKIISVLLLVSVKL